jgi:hypothetical protein
MTSEQICKLILDWEARRDKQGRLKVYPLPSGDGGGSFEVAGINDRYHPVMARRLKALIEGGRHDDAEREVIAYLVQYTQPPASWAGNWRTELFLRDTAFNRGPRGAAIILQDALGVERDGKVGPVTIAALRKAEKDTPLLICKLRDSREAYERRVARRDERSKFWKGLVNRWEKVTAASLS